MAAVEYRHPQIAASTARDLALEQQIGGQVIDGAAQLIGLHRGNRFFGRRQRAATGRAVALIGNTVVHNDAVARGLAVETLGVWGIGLLLAARHRAVGNIGEERTDPGGGKIALDQVPRRCLLDDGMRRHHPQPSGTKTLERHLDHVLRLGARDGGEDGEGGKSAGEHERKRGGADRHGRQCVRAKVTILQRKNRMLRRKDCAATGEELALTGFRLAA